MSPAEDVKAKIWTIFDIIRHEITPDDYHIILFFLSAYKDGIISPESLSANKNVKKFIIKDFEKADVELSAQYLPFTLNFEPVLNRLSDSALKGVLRILNGINKNVLLEHFSEIFDRLLYQTSQSQGSFGGEFLQPVELTRIMCNLAELPENAKVFNPFAGLASFGVYLKPHHWYFGQEFNPRTWTLGALRIMAYEKTETAEYLRDDSILNWPGSQQKFDLIISTPPFGMQLRYQYNFIEPGIKKSEEFLIAKALQSLTEKGKFIALLPQKVLVEVGYLKRIREQLIKEDLIDTIISLPGGLLKNIGTPLVILFVNKGKKYPGRVRFFNAQNLIEENSLKEKVLNDHKLNSLLNNDIQDIKEVRWVDNHQIRENNYNLQVSRYFLRPIEGKKLYQVLDHIKGQRVHSSISGKFIRIRDLRDDKIDFTLDISKVEETDYKKQNLWVIEESCLLLAVRWKELKPTYFKYSGTPILLNQDILAFRVKEDVADTGFLINELHADYIKEQVNSYRTGETVPYISRGDLLEVIIKLPSSIEEQKAKVTGILEVQNYFENFLLKNYKPDSENKINYFSTFLFKEISNENSNTGYEKLFDRFYTYFRELSNKTKQNEFESLKHTLGRPRQNILSWSKNMIRFFESKRDLIEKLDNEFKGFYNKGIIEVIEEIRNDINFITDVLEKGENGLVLEEFENKIIPLSELNGIINELSNNDLKFNLKKQLIKGERLKERGVCCNKTLFRTLLENLLTNANKYAFDKKQSGNEVVIELTEVDEVLVLEVKNNGKPFPRNYDREKFISKYSTAGPSSGSGIGGYDIHRIASYFDNPDWILSLNEDPFYPVKFKFQLPIKLIN